MSSSESKIFFPSTPADKIISSDTNSTPSGKQSSDTSSVPTDLTVSSTDNLKDVGRPTTSLNEAGRSNKTLQEAGRLTRSLQDEIKLLNVEVRKRDVLLEVKKTEYEVELRKALQQAIDAENGRKAGEETCKLRMNLQSKEMSKIQNAISDQLREVTLRQQQLEEVNKKLREKADVAKQRLENFQYDGARYNNLRDMKSADMSIFEFAELIIYRHLEPEKELRRGLEENYSKLQSRFSVATVDISELRKRLVDEEREKENTMVQLRTRNIEVERIKETVKQIDALNLSLDQKVREEELLKKTMLERLESKERELNIYKNKLENLTKEYENFASENMSLNHTITIMKQEFNNIRFKFESMEQKSEQGFNTISAVHKQLQEKTVELLKELSTSIFQGNLDQQYRDQYLTTIGQLVKEQIRTQQYITSVSTERDNLQTEVNSLTDRLNKIQINTAEDRELRSREEKKILTLESEISNLKQELVFEKSRLAGVGPVDVKNTKEYKMLLKDLKLLLSHRDEIQDMRALVLKLQEKDS